MSEKQFKIKLYADGANLDGMKKLAQNPIIQGFTTNPTLMRQAGIEDYEAYGRQVLSSIPNHPISLEVFADDLAEMEKQARYIATWGKNVNIKIPVTNTKGEFTGPIIQRLSNEGVILNITAIMLPEQVKAVVDCYADNVPGIISVFAGRIADSGVDPVNIMKKSLEIMSRKSKLELLWASTRELLNIVQADEIGCHIITVPHNILDKLSQLGKDLKEYSLETVKMFAKDAQSANYAIYYDSRTKA